jgi:hypothetical protein
VAVFVRNGLQRRIGFAGVDLVLPDLKGYRYLERLLASPGREWHVLDLVAAEQGSPTGPVEVGMPLLDDGGARRTGGGWRKSSKRSTRRP